MSHPQDCGTEAPLAGVTPETREAMLDAVRGANGRAALRPAETIERAAQDVEAYLVVPTWGEGLTAADVARETLLSTYGLDGAAHPWTWALYTAGARRLGFPGALPVPTLETGRGALA